MEKSLKAVLFSRQVEFRRTHDLAELALLLRQNGIETPVADNQLQRLNPFAVTFRYEDLDIELITREGIAGWVIDIRNWAEGQVGAATGTEEENDPHHH